MQKVLKEINKNSKKKMILKAEQDLKVKGVIFSLN